MRNATHGTKATGIQMAGPMVLATLDGSKTETRRVLNPQPEAWWRYPRVIGGSWRFWNNGSWELKTKMTCPYGGPGDRLLVTEAHRWLRVANGELHVRYDADHEFRRFALRDLPDELVAKARSYTRWESPRPSRFMHYALCRLPLEVTEVRVERLQDITNEAAAREGCTWGRAEHLIPTTLAARRVIGEGRMTSRMIFADYWDSLHESSGHGWSSNDWVWVVGYRRIST